MLLLLETKLKIMKKEIIEKGKQQGLKVAITFERL